MAVADGGGKSEAVNQGVALAPHLEQQEVGLINIEALIAASSNSEKVLTF